MDRTSIILLIILFVNFLHAQKIYTLKGIVLSENNLPLQAVDILESNSQNYYYTDSLGIFIIKTDKQNIELNFKEINCKNLRKNIFLIGDTSIVFVMETFYINLKEVSIEAELQIKTQTILADVQDFTINGGRKNEVINLHELSANKSTNSSRQIYGRISGANIIENDAAGIQLGIATRGLNPNRITEFNARQNGYDISADAFGYPESYYTPPADFLQQIVVVRGAASLQYGPQFGGLLNFIMLQPTDKKFMVSNKLTTGSFGFLSNNTIVSGSAKKFSYLAAFNYKTADGWRENSGFKNLNGYAIFNWKPNKNITNSLQYTRMDYTMQQAGGLTDLQFASNAQQSFRQRNWFSAQWNILADELTYVINDKFKLNAKIFYMFSNRYSVGNLSSPDLTDNNLARDLQKDNYRNIGVEIKAIKSYKFFTEQGIFLAGVRAYNGSTQRNQGLTDDKTDANFNFTNPENLEGSAFDFTTLNHALFAENIFYFNKKFSITPGVRVENLTTRADGYFNNILNFKQKESKSNKRIFPLLGITFSNKISKSNELYGGIAQSYNAVNFNDIRVVNKNIVVDENLKDVTGFNSELGLRGDFNKLLFYDANLFYLEYNNRIGIENRVDENFDVYQFRTNIASSSSYGFETLLEFDLFKLRNNNLGTLNLFQTFSYTNSKYIGTKEVFILNNKVEYTPSYIYRNGLEYKHKQIKASVQFSYTSSQFTDANNSVSSSTGITGIIPAYNVVDFTIGYNKKSWGLVFSCNNLMNNIYYTRRATGYPGPGILPSDPRSFYMSLEIKL
jgi:Fe(3+) dicitrate transport protein